MSIPVEEAPSPPRRQMLLRQVADATIDCTRRVVGDLRENDGRNPVGIFQETALIEGPGRFAIEVCVIDLDKYPAEFVPIDYLAGVAK